MKRAVGVCSLILCGITPYAWAQAVLDPLRDLENETTWQARDRLLREPSAPQVAPTAAPALDAVPQSVSEPGPTAHFSLQVETAGLIDSSALTSLLAPYSHLPLGARRLELLRRQLSAQLVTQGYVTSVVEITQVDTLAGMARFTVRPGRVEALRADQPTQQTGLEQVFPTRAGEVLMLQDIEQGVHQINRLRLNHAEVRIVPATTPHTHEVMVDVNRQGRYWGTVGADNCGAGGEYGTGTARLRASANVDDLLDLGRYDTFGVTGLHSARSDALVGAYSLPAGYGIWSATAAASRFTQRLPDELSQRGTGQVLSLAYQRTLQRDASNTLSADVNLTRSRNTRRIASLALADQNLTALRAALLSVRRGDGWQRYVEGVVAAGLPMLGRQSDADELKRGDSHAQFGKLELHAGLDRHIGQSRWRYGLQFDAQYARSALYGVEQFIIGGVDTVRGFAEGALAGDRGWLLRQELHAPAPPATAGRLDPHVFVDYGEVRAIGADRAQLGGAGLGLDVLTGLVKLRLSLAKSFTQPLIHAPAKWRVHVSLSHDW